MSHGKGGTQSEGTLVYTRDGRFIPSNEVLERFNNKSCPLLKGKPKIFLFQVCLRLLLGFNGFYLVLNGLYWVLPSFT